MKSRRKALCSIVVLLALGPLAFSNGLNLNSIGTRALTMGGAFVGLADDFSAIHWNPAGLTNLTSRTVGFYLTDIIPSGTYTLDVNPPWGTGRVVSAQTQSKHYLGGMAAYIQPITSDLVAGIGVYTPSGLGGNWDGAQLAAVSGGNTTINWWSKVGMVTIAPTLAYKINDYFSIGGALNINYGMFDINMYAGRADLTSVGFPNIAPYNAWDLGQYIESDTGWGFGGTFGLLFKPNDMISFGATFRTPTTISFNGAASISKLSTVPLPSGSPSNNSDVSRSITWPMWIAGGLAVKPMEGLTITGDLQWTQWSKIRELTADYADTTWGLLMAKTGKDVMEMQWRDATQIRVGAEYMLTPALAIRGGFYRDPSPAPDNTMNILLPNYEFSVITLGLGYSVGGLQIDAGFEYLMGKDRGFDFLKTLYYPGVNPLYDATYTGMPGNYGMKILVPNVSLSYKF